MSLCITTLERYILESINKKNKSILEIQNDTQLDLNLINSVLSNLLKEKLIVKLNDIYCLHENLTSNKISELKDKNTAIIELTEIVKINIKQSIKNKSSSCFNYKKVFLDLDEVKVLKTLMYSIESFLESRTKKNGPTSQEQIIFWGNNSYLNTVTDFISV
jgi:flagellar biosynthesis component FlhA